jgi:DNA-binding LytR/AlgR family response regulator
VRVLEHLPSIKTARKWFMQNAEPDVLFLDIQLRDGVSFDLLKEFDLHSYIIFTTAYDEYAVRAFRVNSVDYLLKPVDEAELNLAIEKCRTLKKGKEKFPSSIQDLMKVLQNPAASTTLYKEQFIVQQRNQWVPVKTSDVALFSRENLNYLHTFSGEKFILDYETLEQVEELLDPTNFYRANRQFILNVNSIHSVKASDNQKLQVYLKPPLKQEVDVSREKAPSFKKWLDR